MGANTPESFVGQLDMELQKKLATIGDEKSKQEPKAVQQVTAESQAERAARICDIILEEK